MDNFYRVAFVTKMGGYQPWVIDVEAPNAKIARAKAEADWYLYNRPHAFGIIARRLRNDEEFLYHWFTPTFCKEV